jgi:hypothetical protein
MAASGRLTRIFFRQDPGAPCGRARFLSLRGAGQPEPGGLRRSGTAG